MDFSLESSETTYIGGVGVLLGGPRSARHTTVTASQQCNFVEKLTNEEEDEIDQ